MHSLLGRLVLIVTIALLPGLLVHIDSEIQTRHTRERLMQDEAFHLVRLVGDEQQRINEGADQVLSAMGSSAVTLQAHPELCQQLLSNIIDDSPRYLSGAIIGLDGSDLCDSNHLNAGTNVFDREYFQRAIRTGAFTVGDFVIGRHTGQPTVHLAKAFKGPDGTTRGVVMVSLNLDWLSDQLAKIPLPPGTVANIRDRNGILLARYPTLKDAVGQQLPPDQRGTLGGSAIGIETTSGLDGRLRRVAYAPADTIVQGLRIVVALDAETSFAEVTSANQRDLILIILASAWAIIATVLLGTRLVRRPFLQLLAVARRWEAGDLSARTGIAENASEFGRLAIALDAMAAAQQAREAALRDSEEEYRATFEQSSIGMTQTALDGTLLRVNEALCAIKGRTRDEMIGHRFSEFTHPDDQAADTIQMQALISGEVSSLSVEKRYIRKDGSVVWVNRWASLLRDQSGCPSRIITIAEDITARKTAQIALEESETRLQLAREAAGFGIWDRDLITNKAIWSEQQWRLRGLGPQPNDVDFEAWASGIHPEDRARVLAILEVAIIDPARRFDATFRINRPDGVTRWLHVKSKTIRDPQGKAIRIVGLTMDVTEARESEAELRRLTTNLEARVQEEVKAREAAQIRAAHAERMQVLGQLAGGIAHDFNNLLQMVMTASTLIADEPGNVAEVISLSQLINEAAERGAATTGRLLAVGRHGSLHTEDVDVGAALSRLKELFVRTLGTSITVDIQTDADLPSALVDQGQLETSLINLATNARDAMPEGGRLIMSARAETIEADNATHPAGLSAGTYVRVRMSDTGSGMDAATLANVGKPFFTTKKAGAGTGLGVALVRSFAERSHGGVAIDSRPGEGTTVTIWLPAAAHPHAIKAAGESLLPTTDQPSSNARLASQRILVVDDEAGVRRVMALQLARSGFDVTAAASAVEALAMVEQGLTIDALITDLSMPGINGIALIRAAQERRPGLPAILITGYAEDGGVDLAIEGATSGTYSLLRKPVISSQLVERIRALLAGRASAEP